MMVVLHAQTLALDVFQLMAGLPQAFNLCLDEQLPLAELHGIGHA